MTPTGESTAPPGVVGPRRRGWLLAAALLAVLVAGVVWAEWLGWPFLARPAEHLATRMLDRRVQWDDAAFRIRFFGRLRVSAAQLEIAAPTWSRAPHLLLAQDAQLEMRYIDLWRAKHGEQLRIERLQASQLDAVLERRADGRASWRISALPAAGPAAQEALPRFGRLQVSRGTLHGSDEAGAIELDAQFLLEGGATQVLNLQAQGHQGPWPLTLTLRASGALTDAVGDASDPPLALKVDATIGKASFVFDGRTDHGLDLDSFGGRFSVRGPSLAALGDPVGMTLPTTAAFQAEGDLTKRSKLWQVAIARATVGASRLTGSFRYDTGRPVPLLVGELGGERLLLADLGPLVGAVPTPASSRAPADRKVLPKRPFDLAALRMMDADVAIAIAMVDFHTDLLEPVRPLRAHLVLAGGVLTVGDIDARVGQGRLGGELRLDGRGTTALWNSNLNWSGMRLEQWIHQRRAKAAPPYVSGTLGGQASLHGQGRSTAEILASLDGHLRAELNGAKISHVAVEVAGLNLLPLLGLWLSGDEQLPVRCAVADLDARAGVLRPRLMALDSDISTIWITGTVSLVSEEIDLHAVVSPKKFNFVSLRTPVHVRGTLAAPKVSLETGPLAGKVAAAVALGLVSPLAALLPLVDPAAADGATKSGCAGLAPAPAVPPR